MEIEGQTVVESSSNNHTNNATSGRMSSQFQTESKFSPFGFRIPGVSNQEQILAILKSHPIYREQVKDFVDPQNNDQQSVEATPQVLAQQLQPPQPFATEELTRELERAKSTGNKAISRTTTNAGDCYHVDAINLKALSPTEQAFYLAFNPLQHVPSDNDSQVWKQSQPSIKLVGAKDSKSNLNVQGGVTPYGMLSSGNNGAISGLFTGFPSGEAGALSAQNSTISGIGSDGRTYVTPGGPGGYSATSLAQVSGAATPGGGTQSSTVIGGSQLLQQQQQVSSLMQPTSSSQQQQNLLLQSQQQQQQQHHHQQQLQQPPQPNQQHNHQYQTQLNGSNQTTVGQNGGGKNGGGIIVMQTQLTYQLNGPTSNLVFDIKDPVIQSPKINVEHFCMCRKQYEGELMIKCSNDNCDIIWFHPVCVRLGNINPKALEDIVFTCDDCLKSNQKKKQPSAAEKASRKKQSKN